MGLHLRRRLSATLRHGGHRRPNRQYRGHVVASGRDRPEGRARQPRRPRPRWRRLSRRQRPRRPAQHHARPPAAVRARTQPDRKRLGISAGQQTRDHSLRRLRRYVTRRENIIAVGNSGTGKTHIGLGLGLAACQKGLSVGFYTAAALVHELLEARDEKRLLRLQRQLAGYKLLIIDELGYVPLSQTGAELLFEVFSQRYERGSTVVTSNLPFDEWTSVFSSERLTGALLDRLTHHVHILEMNGDSYRLNQSKRRSRRINPDTLPDNPTQA